MPITVDMGPARTSRAARLATLAVTIILTLALLEWAARFYLAHYQASDVKERDALVGETYKKNLDMDIPIEGNNGFVRLITNKYGFVGPNWPENKEPRSVRITSLGDSFTAGVNVPYEKNFVSSVGNALSDAIHAKVESLNFGIEGMGTGDEHKVYKEYARNFKPDIVIVWWYSGNDVTDNLRTPAESTNVASTSAPRTASLNPRNIIAQSGLWRLFKLAAARSGFATAVYKTLTRIPGMKEIADKSKEKWHDSFIPPELSVAFTSAEPDSFTKGVATSRKFLEDFKRDVAQDGARLFVVVVPSEMQIVPDMARIIIEQYPGYDFNKDQVDEAISTVLNDLGIAHLNLTRDFERACQGQLKCDLYQCQFCHLSQRGHDLVSERVAPALGRWYVSGQ